MERPTLSFDQILNKHIGALGKWQIFLFLLVTLSSIPPLIQLPQLAFLTPDHQCAQPQLTANGWTQETIREATVPVEKSGYSQCRQFNVSASFLLQIGNTSVSAPPNSTATIPCQHGWTFDQQSAPFRVSFTEEFELICDRKHIIPFLSMAYMIGMAIGYPVGGYLGDRFGRRQIWMISCILSFVFSAGCALSVSIWMFFVFRIAVGALTSVANVAGYVLCVEITNAKHRNTFNFIFHLINDSFSGYAVLAAFVTQNWRLYHVAASIFCVLPIFMFRLVPESPRWLLYRGHIDAAKQVMLTGAKMNGRLNHEKDIELLLNNDMDEISRSDAASSSEDGGKENSPRWYRIFTSSQFRVTTIAMMIIWMAQTMNFYGLSFFSVRLRGNPYVIAFVGGIMGIPAGIVKFCLYHWFDRRRPLMGIFFFGCLTCAGGVVAHITFHEHILQVIFATLGIAISSAGMMMLYTITPELYPTEYRTFATGFLSGSARVGSMLSMLVERMDESIWSALPMTIFCVAFLVSFVMMLVLPSSHNTEELVIAPENLEEKETLQVVPMYGDDTVFGSKLSCAVDLSMV